MSGAICAQPGDVYFIYIFLLLRRRGKEYTMAFVGGSLFQQCLNLFINIDKDELEQFNEINYIDEASEVFKTTLDDAPTRW